MFTVAGSYLPSVVFYAVESQFFCPSLFLQASGDFVFLYAVHLMCRCTFAFVRVCMVHTRVGVLCTVLLYIYL